MNSALFINTRPADRADSLNQALHREGVQVFELPLLELIQTDWSETLKDLYEQIERAQVIVAVSPSAVHFGMQGLKFTGRSPEQLQHIQWIAVGEKTAQTLLEYGIESTAPEVETSEGMLKLDVLQQLQPGSVIAFWRGEGGRQFMMESLHEAGMKILNFLLYTRRCPEETLHKREALIQLLSVSTEPYVLISSEASWLNWLELLQGQEHLLQKCHCFVLGERLYGLLFRYQQEHQQKIKLSQLTDLKSGTILRQIASVQGNK